MGIDRRGFLKVAGLGALGVAGLKGARLLEPGEALASTAPGGAGGRRWAMVVDLRKTCPENCRDCVAACHSTHNVPVFKDEVDPALQARHEVKWIWTETYEHAFPGPEQEYAQEGLMEKKTLVLCNHCDHPPCVRVCPTKATYRRPDGIVQMDFHRCIGCRFCMAACPYGSRSFNWRDPRPGIAKVNPGFPTRTRGVVEKCNFCVERLEKNQPPACVEACKDKMLTFGDLEDGSSHVRELLKEHFTVRRKATLGTQPQIYYIV